MTVSDDTIHIYVDADACPVKDAIIRVAERHVLPAIFVSNSWMRLPDSTSTKRVLVPEGPDAADDWIAERATARDVVVTQDIPLEWLRWPGYGRFFAQLVRSTMRQDGKSRGNGYDLRAVPLVGNDELKIVVH